MRLAISMQPEWTRTRTPLGLTVDVRRGLRFAIQHAQPVPLDTRTWGDQIVFGDVPQELVKVIRVEDGVTDEGWTFTYVVSDVKKPDGSFRERRIHAIVRLAQHGVVVMAGAKDAALVDEFDPVFKKHIVTSHADFSDVTGLAHVWDGLQLNDLAEPASAVAVVQKPSI
ncbi:MAG: hypothetical protein ACKV2T_36810, partial [Kofleriaceae bacterium]